MSSFYQSDKWRNLVERLRIERVNENGEVICEYCGLPITKKYDIIGHHIIPLTAENEKDAMIALNPENIQLIHFACHNKIHKRAEGHKYEGYTQKVYIVYGSPCAGKTTFVNKAANDDDLILDIDRLWKAICNCSEKPNRLKQNVFGIRDCMIDQIRTRTGQWRNAYIIGGYPLRTDRDRLAELLRAELIFIDTPKNECMKRAEKERNFEWKEYIERWFDSYTE